MISVNVVNSIRFVKWNCL